MVPFTRRRHSGQLPRDAEPPGAGLLQVGVGFRLVRAEDGDRELVGHARAYIDSVCAIISARIFRIVRALFLWGGGTVRFRFKVRNLRSELSLGNALAAK